MLLGHYIDVFHGSEVKLTEKDIKSYRKDLLKTTRNITAYFQEEKVCFEGLLSFLKHLEATIQTFHHQLLSEEDHIIEQISEVSSDIDFIVNFEDTLELVNNSKANFITVKE